jgi:hypothetical protein
MKTFSHLWQYLAKFFLGWDVLDKICRENQNTHFMFNNFFSENRTVYEIMLKNVVETEGPQMTSQYGAYALRAGLEKLYARTRKHAHRPICNTYCFSAATMLRTRASLLRYMYIACVVSFQFLCRYVIPFT